MVQKDMEQEDKVQAGRVQKKILVLGGSGHVGRAVVEAFAERGDRVWMTYHTGEGVARALCASFEHVTATCVDVSDGGALRSYLADSWSDEDMPDVFVHCVCEASWVDLDDVTGAFWQRSFDVNVTSAFLTLQSLSSRWKTLNMPGDVVFVSAINGHLSVPSPAAFGTAQGALGSLARVSAQELGPFDIRVNAVVLGPLDGGISSRLDPQHIKDYEHFSSLGRVGTSQEAAQLICWMALENETMTGNVMHADGGL